MKQLSILLSLAVLALVGFVALTSTRASVEPELPAFDYATIRWQGSPESMQVALPDKKVTLLGPQLARTAPPDGADPRTFYLTLVMNLLGKEGYDVAAMTDAQIVMRRAARH